MGWLPEAVSMRNLFVCAALFLAASELSHPQAFQPQNPQPARTARIRGRVVAADTGVPIANATVEARGGGSIGTALTDEQGRYEIVGLNTGRFTLTASKVGYVATAFGQSRPGQSGRWIDIAQGQVIDGIDIRVLIGGVIVVRVIDEAGAPVPMTTVEALRRLGGRSDWQTVGPAGPFIRMLETDDRGETRLSGLAPGEYFLRASIQQAALVSGIRPPGPGRLFVPTFFPGSTAVTDALAVEVRAAQEVPVTLQLVAARSATITGRFVGPDEALARGVTISLRPVQGSPIGVAVRATNRSEFEATVMPGEYVLTGTTAPLQNRYHALVNLSVQGDISDLVVPLTLGGVLTGQIITDTGTISDAAGASRSLALVPAPGTPSISPGSATVFNDWNFQVSGIVGTYLIRSTPGPGWFLKSVLLGDTDITDTPIEITDGRRIDGVTVVITQKQTQLTGVVTDAQRRPVGDFVVLLFPEESRFWIPASRFIRTGQPGLNGEFSIRGLPPGRYLAAAVESLEADDEFDAKFLGRLQKEAFRLTLGEGEARQITVTMQK